MSTTESVGQLLWVGFEGRSAPRALLDRIAADEVGGVVLFARNLGPLDEVAALVRTLDSATPKGAPLLPIAIDQEGGRVQRLRAPLTVWPPMARLGGHDDVFLSEAVGRALGAEVGALGINVNFAPVLDVHSNPDNPIIGDRSFAATPELVARHALAFWRGLESAGVRGCGKHFPGHGDTATDSHLELPRVEATEARLRQLELLPFVEAVRAGVPLMMTAHVVYPAIDERPATLSHRWLTEILRGELGFQGVILSDDLDMKAVADRFPVEQTVVEGLRAGCDAFLACRDPEVMDRAFGALRDAARRDSRVRDRVQQSLTRLQRFRATLQRGVGFNGPLPPTEHALLAARMNTNRQG
jgi:beta-N-acetylhexosaminidase